MIERLKGGEGEEIKEGIEMVEWETKERKEEEERGGVGRREG